MRLLSWCRCSFHDRFACYAAVAILQAVVPGYRNDEVNVARSTCRAWDGRCSTTLHSSGSRRTPHFGSLNSGVWVAASKICVRSGVPANGTEGFNQSHLPVDSPTAAALQ